MPLEYCILLAHKYMNMEQVVVSCMTYYQQQKYMQALLRPGEVSIHV